MNKNTIVHNKRDLVEALDLKFKKIIVANEDLVFKIKMAGLIKKSFFYFMGINFLIMISLVFMQESVSDELLNRYEWFFILIVIPIPLFVDFILKLIGANWIIADVSKNYALKEFDELKLSNEEIYKKSAVMRRINSTDGNHE